jgi:hypothetical protein
LIREPEGGLFQAADGRMIYERHFKIPGLKMHEIICPHCSKAFKIDETGYADILKQVRDSEFDQQLHDRLALAEKEKDSAIELARAKLTGELQQAVAVKEAAIQHSRVNFKRPRCPVSSR